MVVDSIVQTLENNVPTLRRLKILIHGQEAETLAGHVDLTGYFDLTPPADQQPTAAPETAPLKQLLAATSPKAPPSPPPTAPGCCERPRCRKPAPSPDAIQLHANC